MAFRAYVVNGFAGVGFSADGFRGGRQKGAKAKASNMAFTGRVDVTGDMEKVMQLAFSAVAPD